MAEAALTPAKPVRPATTRKQRLLRWLPRISAVFGVLLALLWWAVHRYDWVGPLIANTLRAVVGADAVATIEDWVYAVEDKKNRVLREKEAPKAYWTVPVPQTSAPPPASAAAASSPLPPFRPKDPGPALKSWSAPGDGVWVPIVDPRRPGEEPSMMKTLLHADPERGWSEVFVVAIDLRRVTLRIVPGSQEPKADNKEAESLVRPAVIPERDHEELLAAFNGGFMTEHGGYGMKLDGLTIVSPKPKACTIGVYKDQSIRVAPWTELEPSEPEMLWYRQAPECMVQGNKIHPGILWKAGIKKWGATLDGETVIRRSAIGINASRDILYVSITNHTNARVLAEGMRHAGAEQVAQLDVNWSYPKFVLFEAKQPGGPRKAVALASGFEFSEDEYIRKKARRDFFYLMRKAPSHPDAGAP
ncbi:MAG TPA: hypothetical protein VMS65_03935 [Polyangiaceae bacterium]|nr:hypothetical protein [Polyangiaceae bacterium]